MRFRIRLATLLLSGLAAGSALAQAPNAALLHQRALAATCANCHGTEGRTTTGSAIPSLAGMPREYMITQMNNFKSGARPATVMHQLTKGLTDEQINSVATYFATLKR